MYEILEVDPLRLHLPAGRWDGADPGKLQRQIARHGLSTEAMPVIFVQRGSDGALMNVDGVTRATRVAKLLPGVNVRVQITGQVPRPHGDFPTVGDRLP